MSANQHPEPANAAPMLIGAPEAARMLGVGRRLLAELTSDGSITSVKIGGRRLYPIAGLKEWVSRGCPRRGEGEGAS